MAGRLRLGVGLAAVGTVAVLLLLNADSARPMSGPRLAFQLGIGLCFVVTGLLAWRRRPENPTGRLLTLTGFVWLAQQLTVASSPVLRAVGVVAGEVPAVLALHLVVAFPSGRLLTRFDRALVALAYLGLAGNLARLASEDAGGLGAAVRIGSDALDLAAVVGFVVAVIGHWRRGSPAFRRSLTPVLVAAGLGIVAFGAEALATVGAPLRLGPSWWAVQDATIAALPVGVLVGLLRSRLARSGVGALVVDLGEVRPPERLRASLARALGDPSVAVAYWAPETGGYVDAQGRPVELPPEGSGRAVTVLEAGGRLGALIHDAALREEPELVDAVCAAARLALENERLQARVLAQLEEVRASRARIVAAGDAERRRVERNLHDGAQQRLLTVALTLRMARGRLGQDADPALDALLAEAADELAHALGELRELARGLHPAILTEEGLAAALDTLAERAPVPVEVAAPGLGRLPPAVEAAAYYVVSEAVANAAKHAQASLVTVRVEQADGELRVEVDDDGIGGASIHPGSGLEGLADRVAALGGRFVIQSEAAGGTRMVAQIPCG